MKTIREHLEELPEPYRSQAISNVEKRDNPRDRFNIKVESISQAVNRSMNWAFTSEGYDYWENVYNSLKNEGK